MFSHTRDITAIFSFPFSLKFSSIIVIYEKLYEGKTQSSDSVEVPV